MRRCTLLCYLLLLYTPLPALASSTDPGKVIAGWVEKISFTENGIITKAKLDSGAKTSSIHATNIESFRKDEQKWVRFELVLTDPEDKPFTVQMEAKRVRGVKIKNHDGNFDRRAVVELSFCFDGRWRRSEFTLADRSEFIYDVLLGREFLKGIAVIDPEQTFLTQAQCS